MVWEKKPKLKPQLVWVWVSELVFGFYFYKAIAFHARKIIMQPIPQTAKTKTKTRTCLGLGFGFGFGSGTITGIRINAIPGCGFRFGFG